MSGDIGVGTEVICVANFKKYPCCPNVPTKGGHYVIRSIGPLSIRIQGISVLVPGVAEVTLKEITNPFCKCSGGESAFDVRGFVPVQKKTRDTDISVFRELLDGAPAILDDEDDGDGGVRHEEKEDA